MNPVKISCVYFSPTNTSKRVLEMICEESPLMKTNVDITDDQAVIEEHRFTANDFVILGIPVYGGRVPQVAVERIQHLYGDNTPIALVATYGNRDYDDALLELQGIVSKHGFKVIGAAAVVCEHSIVRSIAKNRPNQKDREDIKIFASRLFEKLAMIQDITKVSEVSIKGNKVYREYKGVPFKPYTTKACNSCGLCISKCPVHAIDMNEITKTNKNVCISCMRCVRICPQGARKLHRAEEELAKVMIQSLCKTEKQAEIFL